jgi:hypothetical protein
VFCFKSELVSVDKEAPPARGGCVEGSLDLIQKYSRVAGIAAVKKSAAPELLAFLVFKIATTPPRP